MNEFVLHSKRPNIKNGKLKKEILRNFKSNGNKNISYSRSNLFFQVHLRDSQKE